MATRYADDPYCLWNPFTPMGEFTRNLEQGSSVITGGDGAYVSNAKGERFVNGAASLWNVGVGLGRKELIDAATAQLEELAYSTCFRHAHPRAIELAAKLVEITAGHYGHAYLGSNGSEATETAMQVARQYHKQSPDSADHQRHKIISLRGAYHGVTFGAMSTADIEAWGMPGFGTAYGPLLPGFVAVNPPYCYRCMYGGASYPSCGLACAQAVRQTIESEGPETVAAFILEPVMGAGGFIAPPPEYYRHVGEICRDYGILMIADEVTTGFGRLGKLFATEDWDFKPDLLCLGKLISSGYLPLAATLATDAVFERINRDGHCLHTGSTASGHPVCAAVGLANIEIILSEGLVQNAARVGEYLKTRICDLQEKHDAIGDVRGRGLMIGLECVEDRATKAPTPLPKMQELIKRIEENGLIVWTNLNIIGLMPPLMVDEGIADKMVDALDEAFASVAG